MRTLSVRSSLGAVLVYHLALLAAWHIGRRHVVERTVLGAREAEAAGLPAGTTEPHVVVTPAEPQPWHHVRAWHEPRGDGAQACFRLRLLGWEAEVPYQR